MDEYLEHHGVKDQRWGFRRWQNPDGSLTPAGKIRYGVGKAKSAFEDAKTLLEYSNTGQTYKIAKNRARYKYKYEVSPKIKKAGRDAKQTAKQKLDDASRKARDVRKQVNEASKSASKKLSRTANDATIQGQIIGRELSYLSRTTMSKINRALNANSREAARLRSYVDSDRFRRAYQAQLTNLKQQTSYKARRAAGENYIRAIAGLKYDIKSAATGRLSQRTTGHLSTPKMTGSFYSFLKKKGSSRLQGTTPNLSIYDDYARHISSWQRAISKDRKFAKSMFDAARGR